MNIALVDDEQVYLDKMSKLCRDFGQENNVRVNVKTFLSGEDFLENFEADKYSLVFIDIYMKGINGIKTAKAIRKTDATCLVVFFTSSMDFMPDAFSCHAFEYITKPFIKERIFDVLKDAANIVPSASRYVEITSNRKTVHLLLSDIISVVSDAHYLNIRVRGGNILRSRMTSSAFMNITGHDPRFFIVNKGVILNADYVTTCEGSNCIMNDGSQYPLRVKDAHKIKSVLQKYQFNKIRNEQKYSRK